MTQLTDNVTQATREPLQAEIKRLRSACRHVVENCYCQPSGQHCDVCLPAALALAEPILDP